MNQNTQAVIEQRLLQVCSATIRAVTGLTNVRFEGSTLIHSHEPLYPYSPYLQYISPYHLSENLSSMIFYRSYGDCFAARLIFSDKNLHLSNAPKNSVELLIFNILEQLRVDALLASNVLGAKFNINFRINNWADLFIKEKLADSSIGILLFTLVLTIWTRLTGYPIFPIHADLIESTRAALVAISNELKKIKNVLSDQASYSIYALAIAKKIRLMLENELKSQGLEPEDLIGEDDNSLEADELESKLNFNLPNPVKDISTTIHTKSNKPSQQNFSYKVYSDKFDVETGIDSLIRKAKLKELRQEFDSQLTQEVFQFHSIARTMQRLFATPTKKSWKLNHDSGYIDTSKLIQVVTRQEEKIFKVPKLDLKPNTLITFLVDCSGSMYQFSNQITTIIDTLAKCSQLSGIATEVLGFTTASWNGGRVYQKWQSKNRSKKVRTVKPGRMNEKMHIIFKNDKQTYQKSCINLSGLLYQTYRKESLDGEAIEWASNRILAKNYKQNFLLVFSDGAPTDSATNLCNGKYYLANHLKQVVINYSKIAGLRIIGVSLNLQPYYANNFIIDPQQNVNQNTIINLLKTMAKVNARFKKAIERFEVVS